MPGNPVWTNSISHFIIIMIAAAWISLTPRKAAAARIQNPGISLSVSRFYSLDNSPEFPISPQSLISKDQSQCSSRIFLFLFFFFTAKARIIRLYKLCSYVPNESPKEPLQSWSSFADVGLANVLICLRFLQISAYCNSPFHFPLLLCFRGGVCVSFFKDPCNIVLLLDLSTSFSFSRKKKACFRKKYA